MGTRAIISINSKPFVATHWDGDPTCLGASLYENVVKSSSNIKRDIVLVAKEHSIDAVDTPDEIFAAEINERFEKIAKKTNGNYTVEQLKKLYYEDHKVMQFGLMVSDDWPMCDIKDYDDFAEYQYDITDGEWTYRELCGCWKESQKKAGKFIPLTYDIVTS
jgi:hypothetical protein